VSTVNRFIKKAYITLASFTDLFQHDNLIDNIYVNKPALNANISGSE